MHRPKAPYVSNKHRMQTKSTGTHLSWDLLDEASRMFFKFRSSQEVESVLLFLDLASHSRRWRPSDITFLRRPKLGLNPKTFW